MARKIIIDTDPGVDDAMAIYFAMCSPELELIGLTTIFGNVHTSLATTNALRLLEIAGRPDIPVAKGADNPLSRPYKGPVPYVHGDDGQGNLHLPPPNGKAVEMTAGRAVLEASGGITIDNVREIALTGVDRISIGSITKHVTAIDLSMRFSP